MTYLKALLSKYVNQKAQTKIRITVIAKNVINTHVSSILEKYFDNKLVNHLLKGTILSLSPSTTFAKVANITPFATLILYFAILSLSSRSVSLTLLIVCESSLTTNNKIAPNPKIKANTNLENCGLPKICS